MAESGDRPATAHGASVSLPGKFYGVSDGMKVIERVKEGSSKGVRNVRVSQHSSVNLGNMSSHLVTVRLREEEAERLTQDARAAFRSVSAHASFLLSQSLAAPVSPSLPMAVPPVVPDPEPDDPFVAREW
jgi:hypothetical protein